MHSTLSKSQILGYVHAKDDHGKPLFFDEVTQAYAYDYFKDQEKFGGKVYASHVYALELGHDEGVLIIFASGTLNQSAIQSWIEKENIPVYDDSYLTDYQDYCELL